MSEGQETQAPETEELKQPSVVETAIHEMHVNSAKIKQLSKNMSKKELLRSILSASNGHVMNGQYAALSQAAVKPKNNLERNVSKLLENLITYKTILLASLIEAEQFKQTNEGENDGKEAMAETGND